MFVQLYIIFISVIIFYLTVKYSPSSIFFSSFVIIIMSTIYVQLFLYIMIIFIICVYILTIREKFYFHYSSFEIDSTEFIQINSVKVGSFDGIKYWKIPDQVNNKTDNKTDNKTNNKTDNKTNNKTDNKTNNKTDKVILFINGNAGNITYRQYIFQNIINGMGMPIYSLDYLSMKDKTIEKIIDLHVRFIKTHIKEKDIIIFGESIGNAIGLELVNRLDINRFIFYAGFTRISDVIQHLSPIFIPFLDLIITEFDNCKIIEKKITNPDFKIIMLHGRQDELILYDSIYLLAKKFNIKLIELYGGHNDSYITQEDFNYLKLNI